ncbi:MAG: histidinol-phosphatase HisJ family protein [Clostridiales Family XIII bacterium]|jgi:histidinol-phosphatase (PHP family)|nr:histidinol-phosphatase HisJ family protein [Clostridiales Family XIII bacterium]
MNDYHTHSSFSDDSNTPMEDMIRQAASLGIREYAVTDHYDPDYPNRNFPFEIDFEDYFETLGRLGEKYKSSIRLIKGLEIGIQHGKSLEKCLAAANAGPYDFLLGSFHCAEGVELHEKRFFRGRTPEESYRAFYGYMLECLKQYKDYDVLGHFNVIDRYADRIVPDDNYWDLVRAIMQLLVDDGKGIEINTSCFRYNMGGRTTPTEAMLKLYVDMGGEIVTTGSDAHRPKDVGHMLRRAEEMILRAGLKHAAVFSGRKVRFVRL